VAGAHHDAACVAIAGPSRSHLVGAEGSAAITTSRPGLELDASVWTVMRRRRSLKQQCLLGSRPRPISRAHRRRRSSERGGPGAAVVAADQDVVWPWPGHARRDRADADLATSLTLTLARRVRAAQVVDQLLEVSIE